MSLECVGVTTPLRPYVPTTLEQARAHYLGFGKYNGQPITTVPVGYLRWMVRTPSTPLAARTAARLILESE